MTTTSQPQPTVQPPSHDQDDAVLRDAETRLTAYISGHITQDQWQALAPTAIPLIVASGSRDTGRMLKDAEAITAMAAYALTLGLPIDLDHLLGPAALVGFDQASLARGQSPGTVRNRRGKLRRLSAAHRGLPWRAPRRADGERIPTLPGPELADQLGRLCALAHATPGRTASDFLAEVAEARQVRRTPPKGSMPRLRRPWGSAVQFAASHGVGLTRWSLAAAVTHEVLLQHAPLAVLARDNHLSRNDLDLGLTHVSRLSSPPDHATAALLRGA